ncbi:MAG: helix-turn-helix domain-containing protein [Vicinamibacterales bacterium]
MAPRSDWKNLNPFRPGGTLPLANPMEDPLAVRPRRGARGRQEQFARMLGISVGTLRNWEQGKRCPQGPARALLRIAAADPEAVSKVLRWNRSRWTDTSGIHE